MELHEWQCLENEEKEGINRFIEENIETVYDERRAYGTSIDLTKHILTVQKREDIKNDFVDENFVGFWCNLCDLYIEPESDTGMISHVIEHLHGDCDEQDSQNLAT